MVSSGKLSKKRINNILAVLSKSLRYAVDVELIGRSPRIGLFKLEAPEVVAWEIDEYARLVCAAAEEGPEWFIAALLAGEAGLRIGEIRALRWQDIDLVGRSITVSQQMRKGIVGTPKGRTRRVVPMTTALAEALKNFRGVLRVGPIVRNADGTTVTDGQTTHTIYRICDRAKLTTEEYPRRSWHVLRHTFGTHAALFGANPWRLQAWMGHKRIDETMRYVHVADAHMRELPEAIRAAALAETDLDRRVIAMLGARSLSGVEHEGGGQVSAPRGQQLGSSPGRFRATAQHC
jgi:integrase